MSEPHSADDGVYGSGRRLLTLDEVAEQLGSSVDQVQQLVDARIIAFSRPDNRLRFDSAALSLWLETRQFVAVGATAAAHGLRRRSNPASAPSGVGFAGLASSNDL